MAKERWKRGSREDHRQDALTPRLAMRLQQDVVQRGLATAAVGRTRSDKVQRWQP